MARDRIRVPGRPRGRDRTKQARERACRAAFDAALKAAVVASRRLADEESQWSQGDRESFKQRAVQAARELIREHAPRIIEAKLLADELSRTENFRAVQNMVQIHVCGADWDRATAEFDRLVALPVSAAAAGPEAAGAESTVRWNRAISIGTEGGAGFINTLEGGVGIAGIPIRRAYAFYACGDFGKVTDIGVTASAQVGLWLRHPWELEGPCFLIEAGLSGELLTSLGVPAFVGGQLSAVFDQGRVRGDGPGATKDAIKQSFQGLVVTGSVSATVSPLEFGLHWGGTLTWTPDRQSERRRPAPGPRS